MFCNLSANGGDLCYLMSEDYLFKELSFFRLFEISGSQLLCFAFSCFFASLLLCFSACLLLCLFASLLLCVSAFLLLCLSASPLFRVFLLSLLLCFSAFPLFPAFLLLFFCFSCINPKKHHLKSTLNQP